MNTQTKTLAIVSSILLSASFAGPAKASEPTTPTTQELSIQNASKITAKATQKIKFERPAVKTAKALAPVEVIEETAVQETTPVAVEAPVPVAEAPTPAPVTPASPKIEVATGPTGQVTEAKFVEPTPAPKVSASGKGAAIAAAAYSQIGVSQDCTALVSNALAAVGINFHGWPNDYASLGTVVGTPQPGDILIYQNAGAGVPHVAIYVGNGQAIHGGFNGSTVLFSANVGSGYFAVRVA